MLSLALAQQCLAAEHSVALSVLSRHIRRIPEVAIDHFGVIEFLVSYFVGIVRHTELEGLSECVQDVRTCLWNRSVQSLVSLLVLDVGKLTAIGV